MLHGIHTIFPPPSVSGHNGFDPISEGKLEKGEGTWSTTKEILGWVFDGKRATIQLPPPKCEKIITLIKKICNTKRSALRTFQQLAGKLQHASFGMPGGRGLFSPLQMAMLGDPEFINITTSLKSCLQDWKYIVRFMRENPTSVFQIVLEYPSYIGYSDACKLGAGGIWCSGTEALHPFLWQVGWPEDIQRQLVTDDNKNGSITINDLELAGAVLNWLALECQQLDLQYKHVGTFCDNTSAVAWAYKLRTSKSHIAAQLLRILSIRIHKRKASGLTPMNIAGEDNKMADVVSRAFKQGEFFAASQNLTQYFNNHFPLTQNKSWKGFQMPSRLSSLVIASLRGEKLAMESLLRLPKVEKNTGKLGNTMQQCAEQIHSSSTLAHSNEILSSMLSLQGSGKALTVKEIRSRFKASQLRCQPYPRPSNWLENHVPFTKKMENPTTSVHND